eukprot:6175079-Pleurochrysis_carterae.AAC.2
MAKGSQQQKKSSVTKTFKPAPSNSLHAICATSRCDLSCFPNEKRQRGCPYEQGSSTASWSLQHGNLMYPVSLYSSASRRTPPGFSFGLGACCRER